MHAGIYDVQQDYYRYVLPSEWMVVISTSHGALTRRLNEDNTLQDVIRDLMFTDVTTSVL